MIENQQLIHSRATLRGMIRHRRDALRGHEFIGFLRAKRHDELHAAVETAVATFRRKCKHILRMWREWAAEIVARKWVLRKRIEQRMCKVSAMVRTQADATRNPGLRCQGNPARHGLLSLHPPPVF